MVRLAAFVILFFGALAQLGVAQSLGGNRTNDADRGFLTGLLEDSLGGEGRIVRIDGFAGALSSTATMDRITIADADGIWLDMRDLSMAWNRTALLRGRIEIATLHAGSVDLARPPLAAPETGVSPEAGGFSLPNLPVSLEIQSLDIGRISLGAGILGQSAELSLQASASLISGSGKADLTAERLDGVDGRFDVTADFDQGTQNVVLSIALQEAANGLAANALDLRDRPSVSLSVEGAGPISDFETTIALDTDGAPRASGTVRIKERTRDDALGFSVELRGDLAPLFPEQYATFLGAQSTLFAQGARLSDGGLDLAEFALTTGGSDLSGSVVLSPDAWPLRVAIAGRIAAQNDRALVIPAGGAGVLVQSVVLDLDYDERVGPEWDARFQIENLTSEPFASRNLSLTATGSLSGSDDPLAAFDGQVSFDANGLAFADPAQQVAIGDAVTGRMTVSYQSGSTFNIRDLVLGGQDYNLAGDVSVAGLDADLRTDFDTALKAANLSRFSGLAGIDLAGSADVTLTGFATAGGAFDVVVAGATMALRTGLPQADAVLAGKTTLDVTARRDEAGLRLPQLRIENDQIAVAGSATLATGASRATFDANLSDASLLDPSLTGPITLVGDADQNEDVWSVDVTGQGPFGATAQIVGPVTGPAPRVEFSAQLPDVQEFASTLSGPAQLDGVLSQDDGDWYVSTRVEGPLESMARVSGRITGAFAPDIAFDVTVPDLSPLVPSIPGALSAKGRAVMDSRGLKVTAETSAPYATSARVDGYVSGNGAPDIAFVASVPDIAPFAPGFSGAARVEGDLQQTDAGYNVTASMQGPYASTAILDGIVSGSAPSVSFRVALPDVAPLGAGISGPLSAEGTARQTGTAWQISTRVAGPAGSAADVTGSVESAERVNLTAVGSAPLGLSAPFLEPRNLQGLARFDLRMNGAPSLGAISGTIQTSGARFSAPNLRIALENIDAQIGLGGGAATISTTGSVATGGTVRASGQVGLDNGFQSRLIADFNAVRVVDPTLYDIMTSGRITVDGPLTGGARIAGQVNITEAQIQVPSSPTTGFSIVPQITHQGASAGARRTLARAGLDTKPKTDAAGATAVYGLDIGVSAPARLFVRGRGLDAELGGSLRISGDTANVVSVGGFQLIRGRLDVLGQRFTLDEGRVVLQGSFDPFLRFVATTRTSTGTASVVIDGPATKPNVRFESDPAGPEDEVLAQIFFGRSAAQLTPFQALQLASAVASLTGEGQGVVSTLRLQFDLDDLDVTTDEDGNVGLALGKYISDNVYVDVLVGNRDDAGVSLNIDLNPQVTVRGTAKANGGGALGIFFEKDY